MSAAPQRERSVVCALDYDGTAITDVVHLPAPAGSGGRRFDSYSFPPPEWDSACGDISGGSVYNLDGLPGAIICPDCEEALAAPTTALEELVLADIDAELARQPRPPAERRRRRDTYTEADVEQALRRFLEEHGRQPTFADIKTCDYLPKPSGAPVWRTVAVRLGWPDPAAPKRPPRRGQRAALAPVPPVSGREPKAEETLDAGASGDAAVDPGSTVSTPPVSAGEASSRPDRVVRALIVAGRAFLDVLERELER